MVLDDHLRRILSYGEFDVEIIEKRPATAKIENAPVLGGEGMNLIIYKKYNNWVGVREAFKTTYCKIQNCWQQLYASPSFLI